MADNMCSLHANFSGLTVLSIVYVFEILCLVHQGQDKIAAIL